MKIVTVEKSRKNDNETPMHNRMQSKHNIFIKFATYVRQKKIIQNYSKIFFSVYCL